MVHIYNFCDKTLVGRCENLSAKFLCENLFKLNFKIENVSVFCNKYDYSSLNFKNKDIYFLLMQKSNNVLNSALANLSGCKINENTVLKNVVEEYYKQCNLPLDNSASLEWLIPENATAITNPNGKTQGYLIKINSSEIFVLPNQLNELKCIYDDCIIDYLEKNYPIEHRSETFKTFGLNENNIKSILTNEIKNKDGISISIFSKGLDNDIVIKSKIENEKFNEYVRTVFTKLEKYVYSIHNITMAQKLENELINQNITFAYAGDFSITNFLSSVSDNISNNIIKGVILPNITSISSFLNSKINEVSAEIAYDVAVKMLENQNADLVFVSLYNLQKDGVCDSYVAVGNKIKIDVYKNKFSGTKEEILNSISQTSMFYLIKRLALKDLKTL